MSYVRTAGILSIVLLAVTGCSRGSRDVTVATAASGAIATGASGLGAVAAGVDVPLTIGFRDQVLAVSVSVGQHVSKGQDLLTLDPQPLIENATRLQVSLQGVQADLGHIQASIAADQVKAPALVPGLQDQAQALQSRANLLGQLLETAHGLQSTVTSPIDGEVLAVNVRPGQSVAAGATLVEIVDSRRIVVTAELPVSAQPEIAPGSPAQITFPNLPGLTVAGTVSGVSPGAVDSGRGFQVVVDAANTGDRSIHHGFHAFVHVPYSHQAGAVVRRMAVLDLGGQDPSVFVVKGDVVQRRQVQVGVRDGENVEIMSGVAPGDVYVVVGTQSLDSGDRVHVVAGRGAET